MRKRDRERALTPKSDRAQESGGTTTNAGERGRGRERTSDEARKWESEKASKRASKTGDNKKNKRAVDQESERAKKREIERAGERANEGIQRAREREP